MKKEIIYFEKLKLSKFEMANLKGGAFAMAKCHDGTTIKCFGTECDSSDSNSTQIGVCDCHNGEEFESFAICPLPQIFVPNWYDHTQWY